MKTETFYLDSARDGLPLSVLVAAPDEGGAKAVFQLAHGMCEHKERYLELIEALCGSGFACVIHDHRGHGESVRSEEDYGFLGKNGAEALVEDLHQVSLYAKERFPGVPLILYGHSMGSLTVRSYLKKHDGEIAGLIVSGSPSANPLAGVGKTLAAVVGGLRGDHHKSALLQKMSIGAYNRKFRDEGNPNAWLSTVTERVEKYNDDPLCGFVFTADGFHGLFELMQDCYGKKGWGMANPSLPILFLSGADDPCLVDEGKFLQAVDFLKQRGYTDVSYRLYPGKRHELLNEDVRGQVIEEIRLFCEGLL